MGYYYTCSLCDSDDCSECPNDDWESPADYYRREGYDQGYDKGYEHGKEDGYKKGYEEGYKKGKSEWHGLICTFARPEGTFCKFLKRSCDGCDLSCNYLCVHDELNFLDEINELDADCKVSEKAGL